MENCLSGDKAIAKDKFIGFYADFDSHTDYYGVFGLETGYMYNQYENQEDAEQKANELNQKYNLEVSN